jgi:hypothetical protein
MDAASSRILGSIDPGVPACSEFAPWRDGGAASSRARGPAGASVMGGVSITACSRSRRRTPDSRRSLRCCPSSRRLPIAATAPPAGCGGFCPSASNLRAATQPTRAAHMASTVERGKTPRRPCGCGASVHPLVGNAHFQTTRPPSEPSTTLAPRATLPVRALSWEDLGARPPAHPRTSHIERSFQWP